MNHRRNHSMRSIAAAATIAAAVFAGCSGEAERVATVSGAAPTPAPGQIVFDSQCASCHGARGEGGVGPALAGHTEAQVLRQVRAPVGAMPMFAPHRLTESGLEDLAAFVAGLEAGAGDGHAHEHGGAGLAQQEIVQIQHVLALRALAANDMGRALEAVESTPADVEGSHREAIDEVYGLIAAGDRSGAQLALGEMITDDPVTAVEHTDDLVLLLVLDAVRQGDVETADRWIEWLDPTAFAELHAASGDPEALIALLAVDHADSDDHHDDETDDEDHHDDESDDEDHHDEATDDTDHEHEEGVDPDHHDEATDDTDHEHEEGVDPDHHDDVAEEPAGDEPGDHHDDPDAEPHDH